MILYNLRTYSPSTFEITKFDDDLNMESSYKVNAQDCECPQGHRPTCRHRKMLGAMLGIVDTEAFYCYDDQSYRNADGSRYGTEQIYRVTANGGIEIPNSDLGAT